MASVPSSNSDWLVVGRVVAAHGLHGWLRVKCLSDFPERLTEPGQRWLQRQTDPEPLLYPLVQGQFFPAKGLYLVQLQGIPDRTTAEAWVGAYLLVPAYDRPPLELEEYHYRDLIGLAVYHEGELLGQVSGIWAAGQDLLEVTTAKGRQVLIPFVKALVPVVDLERGQIQVQPPPGLLESFLS
ncbi:MAG: ribosome maturation factor RimM [Thermostichus sp. DG02_2_bins_29]